MRSVGLGSGDGDDTVTLMVSGGIGIVQFFSVVPVIIVIDRLGKLVVNGSHQCELIDSFCKEGSLCYAVSFRLAKANID